MKILVFGNPLVKADSLPLRILPKLREIFPSIEFKEFDTAENLEDEGRDLVILDAAQGIDKVVLIEDLESLSQSKKYSMHDFDLPITLLLLKKLKAIDSVRIIAVPMDYDEKKAVEEAAKLISSSLSKSA